MAGKRGRPKKKRIATIGNTDVISKKALKNSSVVDYGMEPVFKPLNPLLTGSEARLEYNIALGEAINWYSLMSEEKNLKTFIEDYTEKNFPKLLKNIKKISPDIFKPGEPHSYGIIARLILRGYPIEEKHVIRLEELIHQWSKIEVTTDDLFAVKRIVRDSKISECIALVDGMLDDCGFVGKKKFPTESMADSVLKVGATNTQRLKIHEHFSKLIIDMKQVLDENDPEIKEMYQVYSKPTIKKVYTWLTGTPSEELLKTVKKDRKPRKKKQKTAAQILKLFDYQKSDSELKISSIDPSDILGAQQLWIFNTKTRKLGVFVALDDTGLTVNRKSIYNYDEKTSYLKKVRKPQEMIPNVINAGKVALRHLLEEIRATKYPMKGHIGNTVLLLRVVK
jgi:hypothetical protein